MKRGFTLVELSVVLVIIGLLVGGILAAQSMISTSKVNSTAMQIGQFDTGVMNFKTKYIYLPGDAPAFGGNGDGIIEGFNPGCNNGGTDDRIFTGEMANFWHDIAPELYPADSNIICNVLPGITANISGPKKNVPESKMGKSKSFFIGAAISSNGSAADRTNIRNIYIILDPTQYQQLNGNGNYFMAGTDSTNSAVKPIDLLALDKKIDDSLGISGNVLSGSMPNPGWVGTPAITPLPTCSNSLTGIYKTENNSYECTPLIRIGASAGDPQ